MILSNLYEQWYSICTRKHKLSNVIIRYSELNFIFPRIENCCTNREFNSITNEENCSTIERTLKTFARKENKQVSYKQQYTIPTVSLLFLSFYFFPSRLDVSMFGHWSGQNTSLFSSLRDQFAKVFGRADGPRLMNNNNQLDNAGDIYYVRKSGGLWKIFESLEFKRWNVKYERT